MQQEGRFDLLNGMIAVLEIGSMHAQAVESGSG